MDKDEVRRILSACRSEETADPQFAEALRATARDQELSRWWAEEQIFDQAIARKVQNMPVAGELKARLLQMAPPLTPLGRSWARTITLLAASIAVAAVLFGSWRGPFQPAISLAEYQDEMVSFVRLPVALALESNDLPQLLDRVRKEGGPANISTPPKLRQLEAKGCRTLRFRGHDVALICFKRPDGRTAHLFVLGNLALPGLAPARARTYAAQGEWMSAAWSENGQTYLLALQGGQSALEKYFSSS